MRQRQDSLGFLVSDVARLMRRSFERRLEGSSLTLAQARALVYVSRNEGIRQIDLADLLDSHPMTLARLVDQLAFAGLVERRVDATDRRAYQLFLTPAAQPHLTAIEQVVVTIRKAAVRHLDRTQVDNLVLALGQLRDNLSDR